MSKGNRYLKLVEWSDEDGCFVGSYPELFYWWLPRLRRQGRIFGAVRYH
jgi:hypothetical protein